MASLVELELSHVSPPPASVPATTLPLTFFDINWLGLPAAEIFLFYEYPHPTSQYFMQTTLPTLKSSLSLTLQHFFPLAAKLILPPSPRQLPYILYSDSDSVPLTVKETTADYTHLAGNHPRQVKELQALAPNLPPPSMCSTSGCMEKPLMAIQITLFPNVGICIGFAFNHGVVDGRSVAHFMKSWALVHRCGGDVSCLNNSLPNFDRDQVKDPLGLASIFLEGKRESEMIMSETTPYDPLDTYQVTVTIKRPQVELLKNLVAKKWVEVEHDKSEPPLRISTFAVTCAYMWVCLVKLHARSDEAGNGNDNEICYLLFSADCRERLKLPTTYFGNCIASRIVSAKKSELLGDNGVLVAAKAIGREIMELDRGQGVALKEVENSSSIFEEIEKAGNHAISISLSPKFGMYKTDFGWGRPTKKDSTLAVFGSFRAVTIIESRDDEGGVEFGLPFNPNHDFDRFNTIFHGLFKSPVRIMSRL